MVPGLPASNTTSAIASNYPPLRQNGAQPAVRPRTPRRSCTHTATLPKHQLLVCSSCPHRVLGTGWLGERITAKGPAPREAGDPMPPDPAELPREARATLIIIIIITLRGSLRYLLLDTWYLPVWYVELKMYCIDVDRGRPVGPSCRTTTAATRSQHVSSARSRMESYGASACAPVDCYICSARKR